VCVCVCVCVCVYVCEGAFSHTQGELEHKVNGFVGISKWLVTFFCGWNSLLITPLNLQVIKWSYMEKDATWVPLYVIQIAPFQFNFTTTNFYSQTLTLLFSKIFLELPHHHSPLCSSSISFVYCIKYLYWLFYCTYFCHVYTVKTRHAQNLLETQLMYHCFPTEG